MNCEKCSNRATQILSIGSLGRVETLCPGCVARETTPLDAGLIPYQMTGVEGSFSTEQSLAARVLLLDTEKAVLIQQLADARHENDRLAEILLQRLERHNSDLRAELDAQVRNNAELGAKVDGH